MQDLLSEELQENSIDSSLFANKASNGLEYKSNKNDNRKEKVLNSLPVCRVPLTKLSEEYRAKRCRFFRSGDQWFPGAIIPIGNDKYRTWESVLEDLTRILDHPQHLVNGVRFIFSLSGKKIENLEGLVDGSEYVASSSDSFKNIDYQKAKLPQWRIHARRKEALHVNPKLKHCTLSNASVHTSHKNSYCSRLLPPVDNYRDFLKPKIITVIRNGIRPRKSMRILLNHKTARSFEQVLNDITETIKLDSGAVRKVFTISGKQIKNLKDFYEDDIFLAYGTERHYVDDFDLDPEECKTIQCALRKEIPCNKRRQRLSSPRQRGRPISPINGTRSLPRPSRNHENSGKALTVSLECPETEFDYFHENEIITQKILSRYSVGQTIGDGNFAIVKHCVDLQTENEFALKVIDKAKCKGKEQMIESEVFILRKISHPNIVSLIEDYETTDHLYLVLELVKGGDLFDAIAYTTKYNENEACCMLKDLISAIHYLHQRRIVHRDIKPENLLVEFGPKEETHLKLGDFGLAVEFTKPLYTVCGTPTYVAPEILSETGYGLEVDIWAAGVITYILLCGFPPFVSATNDQEELFDQILRGDYRFHSPYWDSISSSAKNLISSMIEIDQSKRFTAHQVLEHQWVSDGGII